MQLNFYKNCVFQSWKRKKYLIKYIGLVNLLIHNLLRSLRKLEVSLLILNKFLAKIIVFMKLNYDQNYKILLKLFIKWINLLIYIKYHLKV